MTGANRQCGRALAGGCQRAKLQSVKDHEDTPTHKEAANLQMNQSDMKEAVKTAFLQHDHVLLIA